MTQPYIGEIRMFAGNFAPAGWLFCEGQLLSTSNPAYSKLFQWISNTYGGDAQSTFALPDLRGRVPIHMGASTFGVNYALGETGGVEEVTLTQQQIPAHNHALQAAATNGTQANPIGNVLANSFNVTPYINDVTNGNMSAAAISSVGDSQAHTNLQPYLCVSFIISLTGLNPDGSPS